MASTGRAGFWVCLWAGSSIGWTHPAPRRCEGSYSIPPSGLAKIQQTQGCSWDSLAGVSDNRAHQMPKDTDRQCLGGNA